MIKLKQLLLESTAPDIFIPRRMEDRVERMIKDYVRNGIKGNLDLSNMKLTVLPEILKNATVDGNFWCGHNKLTSLKNAPSIVVGNFFCNNNKLTTLEGSPSSVGRNFDCSYNDLTSLEFAPTNVGGNFWCGVNDLTSLEFAPTNVGRDFDCIENQVKFTKEQVRAVCDVKGDIYV
jgi:hypothetical protein